MNACCTLASILILDPLSHWRGTQVLREWRADWLCNGRFRRAACRYRELGRIAGRALVELLVAEPVPAIFDMGSMRKAEQQRLVADLLDELFARNRAPLTIMLDEADAFAPQSRRETRSAFFPRWTGSRGAAALKGREGLDVATLNPRTDEARGWLAKRASRVVYAVTVQTSGPRRGRAISESDIVQTRIGCGRI